MKTRLNLTQWKTYLFIISPIIIILILNQFPFYKTLSFGLKFSIESPIEVILITILYGLQFYLGIQFFKAINEKSYFYILNGLIPIVFWTVACIWVFYNIPNYLLMSEYKQRGFQENNSISDIFIYIFLYHSFVTYFFVNIFIVKHKLNKIKDLYLYSTLRIQFYNPLKKIIWTSWLLVLGLFVYALIYTIYLH